MGDRAAEGRALRARRIDVDPLEIPDRLGEGVDALLRDLDPRRDADLLADARLEAANGGHCAGGLPVPNCPANLWRSPSKTAADSVARRAAPAGSWRSSSPLTAS